ncbi:MAG TPA: endopeptidase La [Acidimicrobiales bacterium]|jgi:ATP-dependent Lon protease|nr:endopeptidase La [Acidimicrobiales bacterium]
MTETATAALPAVPLVGAVLLPGIVVTVTLDDANRAAITTAASASDRRVVLVPDIEGRPATIGVIAQVENVGQLPGGGTAAIVRTLQRARLGAAITVERSGELLGVEPLTDARPSPRVEAQGRELRVVLEEIAGLRRSRRLPEILRSVGDPGALADAATAWSDASPDHKLTVLEATEVGTRVELVLAWARSYLAELQVSEEIRTDVAEGLDKQQREFLLRQQLAAIRKELGEDADDPATDYRARATELPLPAKVREAVDKEIDRLERTSAQSPEQSWIRTWLDRVLDLPWGTTTEDNLDLGAAREVLDADHHGLDEVKDRIIEYLAVRKLRAERGLDAVPDGDVPARRGGGAIVTLVGPPGVGKTSLGESVARAMGRKFVRVALGGIRDEAEIRGHRRTYVGSQPGRIVRAITEAGSMNPVVLLDEVDKLTAGAWSGDPTAALLEVLDPAQNHTFRDHYLEVELDLSDVVFIATANLADTIPGPLLDRMELVRLEGYTDDEKVFIGREHLLPRQLERAGLRPDEVEISDDALRKVIADYTREAGVRSLERELGKLLRKLATKVATDAPATPLVVSGDDVREHLGRVKFVDEVAERVAVPGVATGLAVTGVGGDVLFIEASASDGEAGLTLTGQLGDVMKESAQIALSYVRGHADELGIDPDALNRRFHVHVPAGAIPKDGPSAGVTMTTALVSLLTGRSVKPTVGMTGEVTLRGKVLPIGGVKQKVLAAHRSGLTEVVLPGRNGPDLEDVPDRVRDEVTVHLAETVDDVLAVALG